MQPAWLTDLQTCDVSVTKIFAKLLDFLQLQQVYPQHLYGDDHQIINLLVTREKGFLVFLLMLKMFIYQLEREWRWRWWLYLYEGLDINIEWVRAGTVWRLSGQLTLLKQESQQGEQRVPGNNNYNNNKIWKYITIQYSCRISSMLN